MYSDDTVEGPLTAHHYKTRSTVQYSLVWNSVPGHCRLVEWDARRFCELLGARRILVADSAVSQAAP